MRKRTTEQSSERRISRPAMTPEARENQLIALAVDLVEERLRNGTASSQETTHFLKLGSTKNRLETEKLRNENRLLEAKTEAINSQKETKKMFADAIRAMKRYSGNGLDEEFDEDDEWDD